MIAYIDSPIVLRALLGEGDMNEPWRQIRVAGSSELLSVECHRVIDRLRLERKLRGEEVAEVQRNRH